MSLLKYKGRPFGNFMSQDFLDRDDFFDNRDWVGEMLPDSFWNGKRSEPALNIKETDDHFEIELAAPGFQKKDFQVAIEDGCLKITAVKSQCKAEKEDKFTRREFSYNSFERFLQIPESVMQEEIKVVYKDGILSFSLAKKGRSKKNAA